MTAGNGEMLSRRALLAGTSGLLLPELAVVPACAQVPVAARFTVGEAQITVISDGAMELPPKLMLPGRELSDIQKTFSASGQTFTALKSEINVAIIKIGAEIILVDTGAGPDFVPTLGRFYESMEAAGIKASSITKVVFTHAHPDHLWGVIDPLGGETLFEAAEHLMTETERDFWLKPDVANQVPEAFRGMAAGTHRRLKSIAARIKAMKPGAEIATGVQLIDTGGHTPGHVSVLVRSGGQQLLIGSDVLTQSVISFAEPGWTWGPDLDNERAIASRRMILDRLATERIELLGYHLRWPGRGRVERAGTAYRFVPAA